MPKLLNKKRGEVEVKLGEETLTIIPTLAKIAAWEEATGKHWLAEANRVLANFGSPNPEEAFSSVKAKDLIYFFYCLSEEDFTEEEVGRLIQEEGLVESAAIYCGCLVAAIAPNSKVEEAKEAKVPAKKKARRKTTTRKKKT